MLAHGHSTTATQKAREAVVCVCMCVCVYVCKWETMDEIKFKTPKLTEEEYLIVTPIQVSKETLGSTPYYSNPTIKGRFKLQRILNAHGLDRKKMGG